MDKVFINIILVLMVVPLVGFIYRYARYSPWRATWQGIILMGQNVALLALVTYYLFDAVLVTWTNQWIYLVAILTLIMVLFWFAFIGLLHVQTKHGPVSRRQGSGLVNDSEIERTNPRNKNLPPGKK